MHPSSLKAFTDKGNSQAGNFDQSVMVVVVQIKTLIL